MTQLLSLQAAALLLQDSHDLPTPEHTATPACKSQPSPWPTITKMDEG